MSGNGASRCARPRESISHTLEWRVEHSHSRRATIRRPSVCCKLLPYAYLTKQRTVICVHHKKIIDLVLYVTHLKVKA